MPQLTLADFRRRTWDRLEGNQIFYVTSEVDRLINEGARVTNLFTGFNQTTVFSGLTTANWMWYRTPSPLIFPTDVFLDGKQVQKSSIQSASNQPTWLRGIVNRKTVQWIPVGISLFGLVPPDPIGGKTLEVQGVATPAVLVLPGDTLSLNDDYADLITDYAVINLILKEGGRSFKDAVSGYNGWLKKMKSLERWTTRTNPRFWVDIKQEAEAGA